jgi:aspartyl-tRNA(Asn)/glutamyl-tRNA(Gln) amidotransferase subunit B
VPLLEVVSRPELRTPEEARDYLVALKQIMRYAGISECDMEKGSLRCDANLSLMPAGSAVLGTKVEVKNLNSFRMVQRALACEERRQAAVLDGGGAVAQETRLWDEQEGVTRTMRTKEESEDYRYFPEPDLPPRRIEEARLERLREELPEPPMARRERFRRELGLSDYDAMVLTLERNTADFFEAVARACGDPKGAANWVQGEVLRHLKEKEVELAATGLTPENLGRLVAMVRAKEVTGQTAKKVFDRLARQGGDPAAIVAGLGLGRIEDEGELERLVRRAVAENPEPVAHYRKGKESALKALMGPIMRATRGRADPRKTMALIRRIVEDG